MFAVRPVFWTLWPSGQVTFHCNSRRGRARQHEEAERGVKGHAFAWCVLLQADDKDCGRPTHAVVAWGGGTLAAGGIQEERARVGRRRDIRPVRYGDRSRLQDGEGGGGQRGASSEACGRDPSPLRDVGCEHCRSGASGLGQSSARWRAHLCGGVDAAGGAVLSGRAHSHGDVARQVAVGVEGVHLCGRGRAAGSVRSRCLSRRASRHGSILRAMQAPWAFGLGRSNC